MKENPTSCSRSRLMYEYVGRRDNWIGGKRPFLRVVVRVGA